MMTHRIQISRSPAATLPATRRHFSELVRRYGQVRCIDLMSERDPEAQLAREYHSHVAQLRHEVVRLGEQPVEVTAFDFHARCRNGSYENLSMLIDELQDCIEAYGFFVLEVGTSVPAFNQAGVFRTNCVDCLDRTNVVQTILSRTVLEVYLLQLGYATSLDINRIFDRHSHLWAENGDSLSKIYAGTGALKSEYTRSGKISLAGLVGDARKTVNRFVINNFQDKSKQEMIDLLLGKALNQRIVKIYDPVQELVFEEMQKRLHDFSTKHTVSVVVGTYNLNGILPSGESLAPWLISLVEDGQQPELFVIGFQEIVELVPQQIVFADPEKLQIWEKEINKQLNHHYSNNYVLLRTGQLVGTALAIYAQADVVSYIRNVECAMKKTGLKGMAGNKGAVAIRMDYHDTSLCFVTAHMFAGHYNVEERNKDYHTINSGLSFRKGHISDHKNIVWLGDFNYRIDLSNDQVRYLIDQRNLAALREADQLLAQWNAGLVFSGFTEGDITFLPTYKYDNGTESYDSSEKARIPAWTDRVLYRGENMKLIGYSRAELLASDHRPVMALFEIEVTEYDEKAKADIQQILYSEMANMTTIMERTGKNNSAAAVSAKMKVADNKPKVDMLISFDDDSHCLPQPSSANYQWWNDGPTKVKASPSSNASTNPFAEDLEDDITQVRETSLPSMLKTVTSGSRQASGSPQPTAQTSTNPFADEYEDDSYVLVDVVPLKPERVKGIQITKRS